MFEISTSEGYGHKAVAIIHLKGEFDAAAADQFDAQAKEMVDEGAEDVLVDLSNLTYMSSTGFRSLHNLFYMLHPEGSEEHKRVMDEGVRKGTYKAPHLKLLNPNKRVMDLLTMVSADMYLEIIQGDLLNAVGAF